MGEATGRSGDPEQNFERVASQSPRVAINYMELNLERQVAPQSPLALLQAFGIDHILAWKCNQEIRKACNVVQHLEEMPLLPRISMALHPRVLLLIQPVGHLMTRTSGGDLLYFWEVDS
ncbi:unnamed protein product [Victoria cruziana]